MRYIISISAAAFMFANALCDVPVANEEVKVNEDIIVDNAIDNNDISNAFNSVYLGLGIGGSFLKHSTQVLKEIPNADKDRWTWGTHSPKANRVMGTFVAGAGKIFNNHFYFGGDVMLDVMKSKKKSYEYEPTIANDVFAGNPTITLREKTTHKGFSWNAGARFGYASDANVLTYVKAGVSFDKAKTDLFGKSSSDHTVIDENLTLGTTEKGIRSISNSKIAPMVALGVEKVMTNGLSGRVEVEYDFKAKKDNLKRKGGIKARLMLAKHFGF